MGGGLLIGADKAASVVPFSSGQQHGVFLANAAAPQH